MFTAISSAKLSSIQIFAAGFAFLLGSAVAIAFSQFVSGNLLPWLSLAFSAGAIVCTVTAVLMRRRE